MQEDTLFLNTGYAQVSCRVHPVVIFNILDHFVRRNEGQDRVIGTLLGYANESGNIEIRNCFPVPHTETEQVAVDMEFHRQMYELHQKTAPKEVIVGWYATGMDINENSVMIHNFYWSEMGTSPVHLVVDTALTHDTMGFLAYTSSALTLGEKALGSFFIPVPLDISSFDAEKIGLDVLARAKDGSSASLVSELDTLHVSLGRLLEMLDTITKYVDAVTSGKVKADAAIGRFLMKAVSRLPKADAETLDKIFNNSIQDLLMVVYLANLTRVQLSLAEKLQHTVIQQ